ncbi:MAG: hypothetical protein JSR66_07170 [Proteobacteria bacterium]|nr:hypothetical protein [Pseudomonadota bacterium]
MQSRHSQRGQAMSELITAMAFFVPLVLAVIYVGKYVDIKHQAIQASRYAAMERAMDPKDHEDDTTIGNETVARFFRDGGKHNIGFRDKADEATAGDLNANWMQPAAGGAPMIAKYSDITVKLSKTDVTGATLAGLEAPAGVQFSGLDTGEFGVQANVEVPIANVADHGPLTALMQGLNLKVAATTVMAGDPWNAANTQDVANHFTPLSVPARALSSLSDVLDPLFKLLTDQGAPRFGCVKADVVPPAAAHGAQYDPMDNPVSPSNPNDKCL